MCELNCHENYTYNEILLHPKRQMHINLLLREGVQDLVDSIAC